MTLAPLFPISPTAAPVLRDYQEQCLNAITGYQAVGGHRALVALPTGTGKTVIFAQLPRLFPGKQMLILAHRKELLAQAADKLRDANPALSIEVEQADRHASHEAQVVVASIQTFAVNERRLKSWDAGRFGVIVADEAHHALARGWMRVLSHFGLVPGLEGQALAAALEERRRRSARAGPGPAQRAFGSLAQQLLRNFRPAADAPLLVGFTATPSRTDGGGLEWLFDKLVFSRSIREMMEAGWLCPIRGQAIATGTAITDVRVIGDDFAEGELSDIVNTPRRNALAVQAYLDYAQGRQALVFAVDVKHTQDLLTAFKAADILAEAVVGGTPSQKRAESIRRYRAGEIRVLVNCMVLTEGFDAPETSCVLMARPTKSSLLYTQMLGRGTRIAQGKPDLLVLDMVDIGASAGVQTLNTLFGLSPDENTDDGLLAALLRVERDASQRKAAPRTAYVEVTEEVDPLRAVALPEDIAAVARLAWVRIPAGYALGLPGQGQVGLIEHGFNRPQYAYDGDGDERVIGKERVLEYVRLSFRPELGPSQDLGTFASATEGLLAAEAWVKGEHPETVGMLVKTAKWRTSLDGATPKQIALLKQLGLDAPDGLTKGQASSLIDAKLAESGPRMATPGQKWRLRKEHFKFDATTLTFADAKAMLDMALGPKADATG